MKENLDELTIENFRIFAESNTFKFTDLNIYTGANNSGKSTIIKAIKLFADGLSKSDFPALDLISEGSNLGRFENLINKKSQKKTFKIGFTTKVGTIPEVFKVFYTFWEGAKSDEQFRETALFDNLEVIEQDGKIFWGIYANGNIERKIGIPSENSDPGLMEFRLNVSLLKKHLVNITDTDFSAILDQLDLIKGDDECWWGESFSEEDYISLNHNLSTYFLRDFLKEMIYDRFFNLAEYDLKHTLYWKYPDFEKELYSNLLETTDFYDFLDSVISPIFDAIISGLDLFRNKNILHIVSDTSQERLIKSDRNSEYLKQLYRIHDIKGNIGFVRESLRLFGIDGVIKIEPHLNSAFEVNLITDVQSVREKKKKNGKFKLDDSIYNHLFESMDDYAKNPKINVADLGKGTSNIIKLILKIASILFSYKDETVRNEEIPMSQGWKTEPVVKKTILIEEPEAFLHPNWQSSLVDFFIYCQKQYKVQFIIETHSVYLIQRLQLLIAKNEFDPTNATILYFNTNEAHEKYYRINIRKDGILKESFGSGFYDETARLTADILNAQNIN
ncbi:MAG: AAA family ATPase [Bacteroidetes bacterium]|nr:AAA family ATPase [Bacteroidota bacterium]